MTLGAGNLEQRSLPMADCHNDLLLGCLHQRERGVSDPFGTFWLPQLRDGGVVLQVLPVYVEEQFIGEGALRRTLLLLEEGWRIAERHADSVEVCLFGSDIERVISSGRIALVLALEGTEGIGRDLDALDVMFRLGVRLVSMTWNRRTMMADGIGERDTGGKLTALGVEAVQAMAERSLILDVSHLSEAGFWHVAEASPAPFVASHSSCRALQDHPRNLTDAQLTAIRDSGGFVALNAFGPFLAEDASVDSLIAHAAHASATIGADRVGLGMDFMYDLMRQIDPILGGALVDLDDIPFPDGLRRPADLAALGPRLRDALGDDAAASICSLTLRRSLSRLMPAAAP